MPVVLKIKSGSELYRIVLDEDKFNFEGIQEAIQTTQPHRSFVVKYLDDEDELCTLCPSTFADFAFHASDNAGKKLLKVEIFEDVAKSANSVASACNAQVPLQNSFASFMDKGLAMLKSFQERDFLLQGHRHGHLRAIKSLKFTLANLQRNGLLNATSFAALFVNALPNIMTFLVEESERVNWKFGHLLPKMQAYLEKLQNLLASTDGMEHCAQFVADWREQKILPSEACLQVIPALLSLPFSSQVKLFEEMYMKIESGLQWKLRKMEDKFSWMPVCPMVHDCVTCDGCDASPIQGLRFKCKTRPNYDLCAGCYTRKDSAHDGDYSSHEFEMISFPNCTAFGKLMSMFKGCDKGKGKGKGKSKGTGWKGCCKDNGKGCGAQDIPTDLQQIRPCARDGCTFAATWHPTHCCAACAHEGVHGGRCEKQVFLTQAPTLDEEKCVEEEHEEMISFPNCNAFGKLIPMFKGCGKGKGKGKSKGKGWKGCCKGNGKGCGAQDIPTNLQPIRPCARDGCTFAATWHPTHCCVACAHEGMHGGRCEKQVFLTQAHTLDEEKCVEAEHEEFEVVESASVELPCSVVGHDEKCQDGAKKGC